MEKSEYAAIGKDMNVIDKLVSDPEKVHALSLFLVHEDTNCIVIDEGVFKYLSDRGYTDIYFEELEQV
jgi:hypothetical protein